MRTITVLYFELDNERKKSTVNHKPTWSFIPCIRLVDNGRENDTVGQKSLFSQPFVLLDGLRKDSVDANSYRAVL